MSTFFTEAEVAEFRELAESRMVDTCRITKAGGEPTRNPATGKYDSPPEVVVYEGKCYIPKAAANTRDAKAARAGEASWAVGEYPLGLPISDPATADVAFGMTVTYLTARDDPSLVGRVFGITAPIRQTTAKDRRFKMKEPVG